MLPIVNAPDFVCAVALTFIGAEVLPPGGAVLGPVQATAEPTPVAKRATSNVARAAFWRRLLCMYTQSIPRVKMVLLGYPHNVLSKSVRDNMEKNIGIYLDAKEYEPTAKHYF